MSIDYLQRASKASKMVDTLPDRIHKVDIELDNIKEYVVTQDKLSAHKVLYDENEGNP